METLVKGAPPALLAELAYVVAQVVDAHEHAVLSADDLEACIDDVVRRATGNSSRA